jgi:hypothetical protein
MHLHPVLATQMARELHAERTERAMTASALRRLREEQSSSATTVQRLRRRRRLFARLAGKPGYAA